MVEVNAYYANRIDFAGWRERIAVLSAAGQVSFFDSLQLVAQPLGDLDHQHSRRFSVVEWQQVNTAF